MGEQSRKHEEISIPGEGSGIPGADPFVYANPGDSEGLKALLTKLAPDDKTGRRAANSQEEEPLRRPRGRKAKGGTASKGAEGTTSEEARGSEGSASRAPGGAKRGVNPQWLTFAVVAIVGPVIVLLLVLLMSRPQAPQEGAMAAGDGDKAKAQGVLPGSPAVSAAEATSPAAMPSAAPSEVAPKATGLSSATPAAPKATGDSGWKDPKPAAETPMNPKPSEAEPTNAGSGAQGDVW